MPMPEHVLTHSAKPPSQLTEACQAYDCPLPAHHPTTPRTLSVRGGNTSMVSAARVASSQPSPRRPIAEPSMISATSSLDAIRSSSTSSGKSSSGWLVAGLALVSLDVEVEVEAAALEVRSSSEPEVAGSSSGAGSAGPALLLAVAGAAGAGAAGARAGAANDAGAGETIVASTSTTSSGVSLFSAGLLGGVATRGCATRRKGRGFATFPFLVANAKRLPPETNPTLCIGRLWRSTAGASCRAEIS